jgi:uncharacterized protein
MQINVKSLKREGHLDIDTNVELPRVPQEVVDVAALSPVHVLGTATWADPMILVEATVQATISYVCSRCLTTFDKPLSTRLAVTYTTSVNQADEEIPLIEEDTLNLTSDLEESIFLSLDEKPLCRVDCKGLCPECGVNRNEEACSCDTRTIDPRLAALKDLLSDEESE